MSLKSFINSSISAIRSRCIGPEDEWVDNIAYWQNRLFSRTIEFVIPLSLIAWVSGIWYCFQITAVQNV